LRPIQYNRTTSFLAIATQALFFFLDASPGAYTDAASPNHNAPLLALFSQQVAQRVALLADVSQPLMSRTGVFTGK
jgi:hypothetical protein